MPAHLLKRLCPQHIQLGPRIQKLGGRQRRRRLSNRKKLAEDGAQHMLPSANLGRIKHGSALHKKLPPQLAQLLQRARPERLHAETRLTQRCRRCVHCGARLRSHWNEPVVFKNSNGIRPQFVEARWAQRDRRACRVARILPTQRAKHQRHVGNGARQWPNRPKNLKRPHARRQMAAARNAPRRRLERADAGEVRGHAHRAAAIAAQPRRRKPCGDASRLASARPARRALYVPRIQRTPGQEVRRLVSHQKLRAIGRAQNQRSRRAQPRHHHCIFVGDFAFVQQAPNLALESSRGDR